MAYSAVDRNGDAIGDDGMPQDELGQIHMKMNQTTDEVTTTTIIIIIIRKITTMMTSSSRKLINVIAMMVTW